MEYYHLNFLEWIYIYVSICIYTQSQKQYERKESRVFFDLRYSTDRKSGLLTKTLAWSKTEGGRSSWQLKLKEIHWHCSICEQSPEIQPVNHCFIIRAMKSEGVTTLRKRVWKGASLSWRHEVWHWISVTDRHPHIQTFLREANISHYYNVCHMEKGIIPCVPVCLLFICIMYPQSGLFCKRALCSVSSSWINNDADDNVSVHG